MIEMHTGEGSAQRAKHEVQRQRVQATHVEDAKHCVASCQAAVGPAAALAGGPRTSALNLLHPPRAWSHHWWCPPPPGSCLWL